MANIRDAKGNVRDHAQTVARPQGSMIQGTGEPAGDDTSRLGFLRQRVAELQHQVEAHRTKIKRVRAKLVELRRGAKDINLKETFIDLVDLIDEEPNE